MITRRDFIARLMGGAAAIALSPMLDLAPIEPALSIASVPTTVTVGCINRATFAFWRNSQTYWLSPIEGPMVLNGELKGLQALIDG